jgi:hypothetical protein
MLERHGRREADDGRPVAGNREPFFDLRLEFRKIVAAGRRPLVERVMLTAVDRFLGGEALDFLGQLGRRAFAELADAFDEEGFAGREGGGERVIDGRRFDSPTVPQAGRGSLAPQLAVEMRNRQVGRCSDGCAHGFKLG